MDQQTPKDGTACAMLDLSFNSVGDNDEEMRSVDGEATVVFTQEEVPVDAEVVVAMEESPQTAAASDATNRDASVQDADLLVQGVTSEFSSNAALNDQNVPEDVSMVQCETTESSSNAAVKDGKVPEDALMVPGGTTKASEKIGSDSGTDSGKQAQEANKKKTPKDLGDRPRGEVTRTAKKRGATLQKKAMEFMEVSDTKLYLVAEYRSGDSVLNFNVGEPFGDSKPADPAGGSATISASVDDIRKAVSEEFSKGLPQMLPSVSPTMASQSSSNEGVFNSPSTESRRSSASTLRRKNISGMTCLYCFGNEGFVKGTVIPAYLWTCSFGSCQAMTHGDCIGIPGKSQEEMKRADVLWYCPLHKGAGRPPVAGSSTSTTDTEGDDSAASIEGPPQPTSTRRTRSSGQVGASGSADSEPVGTSGNKGKGKRGRPKKNP